MKSKINKSFIIILMLLLLTSCSNSSQREVTKALGIDVSDATLTNESNTHGGFHNDGTTYIELTFSGKRFEDIISKNSKWNKLPLNDNLTALVYGKDNGQTSIGPYLTDDDGKMLIPSIKNGYYFVEDKQGENDNIQDDPAFLKGSSFNFIIAIYDMDSQILYYCEYDS